MWNFLLGFYSHEPQEHHGSSDHCCCLYYLGRSSPE